MIQIWHREILTLEVNNLDMMNELLLMGYRFDGSDVHLSTYYGIRN